MYMDKTTLKFEKFCKKYPTLFKAIIKGEKLDELDDILINLESLMNNKDSNKNQVKEYEKTLMKRHMKSFLLNIYKSAINLLEKNKEKLDSDQLKLFFLSKHFPGIYADYHKLLIAAIKNKSLDEASAIIDIC